MGIVHPPVPYRRETVFIAHRVCGRMERETGGRRPIAERERHTRAWGGGEQGREKDKNIMVDAGFEPAKLIAFDLQSNPFDHSGNQPMFQTMLD